MIPQIARVGLKRLMILFVLHSYYGRGEDTVDGKTSGERSQM